MSHLFFARLRAGRLLLALIALAAPYGCTAQSGNSWTSWTPAWIHPSEPAPIATPAVQTAQPAHQWREVQPEVVNQPEPPQPPPQPVVIQKKPEEPSPQPTPRAQPSTSPTVTSAMNSATQHDAQVAIAQVNKRLAQADGESQGMQSEQITVIRRLRDSAQQAFNEQDYLTARSLALKASVLVDQLPAATPHQPSSH
ncbi:MAG TPA: hypothetical protein VKB84_01100 [Candidatus Binataceae bacterium]|jgi:hypothetical protein|nr:hypothetical protein [Candidatus Binataceae bacterium]